MLVAGSNMHEINVLKQKLANSFAMKDLGATKTTRKKDIGEGHACDGRLRSITNVTYGDVP